MRQKFSYVMSAALALLFLILLSTVTFAFIFSVKRSNSTPKDTDTVYIYVSAEVTETADTIENVFFIREYNKKIGIFDRSGKLIQIIDTYVKTLPKSEQTELQEGFWVESDKELYSIIEAYTD